MKGLPTFAPAALAALGVRIAALVRITIVLALVPLPIDAQTASTPATGDNRGAPGSAGLPMPSFPATCAKVAATKYSALTNTINVDPYNATATVAPAGSGYTCPGTLGCTGGTDFQPSANAPNNPLPTLPTNFVSAETVDNTAIQAALTGCTSGQAVELTTGAMGQNALVAKPFSIPTGVSLNVDAGVTLYASRAESDYGGTNCGQVVPPTGSGGAGKSNCNPWITLNSTSGSGIYGYGVLDARGWSQYTTQSGNCGQTSGTCPITQGFYANRILAYMHKHGGAINGSPACPGACPTPGNNNWNSYGPDGIHASSASGLILFKMTLRDAGNFQVNLSGDNNVLGWGIKLFAPFEVSNTDGFDPQQSTNVTLYQSYISNGDNQVAIKADGAPSSNISILNNQTGAGIGLQIGLNQTNGVTNVLFNGNVHNGNLYNTQSLGDEINGEEAATVQQVTFSNECLRNENVTFQLLTTTGSVYKNILAQNITCIPSTAPYTPGACGQITFQGQSANPIGIQVNNFQLINGATNSGGAMKNAAIYKGPGTVDSTLNTQFACGTNGVTCAGSPSSTAAYACSNLSWSPLVGELNIQTAANNNNQQVTFATSSQFTLEAVLQPTTEISTKEAGVAYPSGSVEFFDNCPGTPQSCTPLATVPLSGDGFYAGYTVGSSPSGTHNYIAWYPGDTNYPAFQFGAVQVITTAPTTATPAVIQGKVKISGAVLIY